MTQFIQYLYEYENGKRIRNIGFMKVEKQMDKSVIQIYANQIDEIKGIRFEREDGSRYMAAWEEEQNQEEAELEKMTAETEETIVPVSMPEIVPKVEEYIVPIHTQYEKIQRQDLSRLPRKEWRIANNSFLLHGFYNYHHLLYIEEEDKTWIGVPGIFHEKEKTAAEAFGFPEFRRIADVKVELSKEEQNTYEDFGYWCRQVERS